MLQQEISPKICIIVLNWNKSAETIACLDSLLPAVQKKTASVFVCDNASTDSSIQKIQAWAESHFTQIPNIRCPTSYLSLLTSANKLAHFTLVRTEKNLGYAGGNNIGIQYALAHHTYDYILLLNNDTIIHPTAVDALLSCAEQHPEIGILGSTIADYDQPDTVQCAAGCIYHPITTIFKNIYQGLAMSKVKDKTTGLNCDYISGAASFFRTEVFSAIGLLDERFFLYYEELDFALRLKTSSYTLGWCPNSIVLHKSKINESELAIKQYHENLSTLLFTHKHYPRLLPISALLRFIGKFFYLLYSRRLEQFSCVYCAYRDFFRTRQSPFVKSDLQRNAKALFLGLLKQ
jgi:GT2 family glycosyltransferase